MKIIKWALIVWSVCATLIVLLATLTLRSKSVTETNVFCAYNRLFVEFDENGKKWGTMMLDFSGRPIPCKEDIDLKVENTI